MITLTRGAIRSVGSRVRVSLSNTAGRWWTLAGAAMVIALATGTWWLLTQNTRGSEIATVLALPLAVLSLLAAVATRAPPTENERPRDAAPRSPHPPTAEHPVHNEGSHPGNTDRTGRTADFVADLRRLRLEAGQPSVRTMSATTHYSHTALAGALSSGRLPSLDLTLAFVRACGGDEQEWRSRWAAENARINLAAPPAPADPAGQPSQRLRRIPRSALAGITMAVPVGAVSLLMVTSHHFGPASTASINRPIDANTAPTGHSPTSTEVPGDKTEFVTDITIPDGSTVQVGESFVKTWEIRNTGTVTWTGRYLQRLGATSGFGICSSPARVPIPLTRPGESVQISVNLVAPSLPGSCRTDWKMVNAAGRYFFPHEHGLYTIINVSDLGQGPDQNH